jgi:hypothetical protein
LKSRFLLSEAGGRAAGEFFQRGFAMVAGAEQPEAEFLIQPGAASSEIARGAPELFEKLQAAADSEVLTHNLF